MNESIEQMARSLQDALPRVKSGSLRIWGEWFGKPYDNHHVLKECSVKDDVLHLHFDEGETLSVWFPDGVTFDASTFQVAHASRVRWEWYYYGREKIAPNRYFQDFVKVGDAITVETNIDWYKPKFRPRATEPAVKIV